MNVSFITLGRETVSANGIVWEPDSDFYQLRILSKYKEGFEEDEGNERVYPWECETKLVSE